MFLNIKKKYFNNNFSTIVILFIISKLIIFNYFIQIHHNFSSYWQLSNLSLLENDLINTIKFLHMQPPLWNIIVGIILKLTNGNLVYASKIILFFHWTFSFLILMIIKFYLEEFKLSKFSQYIVYLIYLFHPSVLFYENLPYYPHLVVFLFSLASITLYKLMKLDKFKYEIFFYIIILILIYLISAFVPLLLIAFFIIFRIIEINKKKDLKLYNKLKIFIPILIISFLPYFKNFIIFGTFTKGTWSGLQLATTTTHIPNNIHFNKCGLGNTFGGSIEQKNNAINDYLAKYKKNKINLNHASIIGEKSSRNNIGMIARSEWCLAKNIELINKNKYLWIKGRINEFLLPHTQFGIDYDIIEFPKGYEKIKKIKQDIYNNQFLKRSKQILILIFMCTIYAYFAFRIFEKKEKNYIRIFYLTLFMLYGYIILISSLFGNQEGQRFMHYGFIIQMLFYINILKPKIKT